MLVLLGNSLAPSLRSYFQARIQTDSSLKILPASIGKFASSEAFCEIKATPEDIQNQPVTIIQSLGAVGDHTSNDFAIQLLQAVRTLKRNGAGPIWVVMPFIAYSRQDRPFDKRMTSVGIDDFAYSLKQAGAAGVSSFEIHSAAGLKFLQDNFGADFVYNLDINELIAQNFKEITGEEICVIGGPDAGSRVRVDNLAQHINATKFSIEKKHVSVNDTEVTRFTGEVDGKNTLTVDDMIDTGGTIENSQLVLQAKGSQGRYVYAPHGIFSKGALERLFTAKTRQGEYALTKLVVSDTIDIRPKLDELSRQYGAHAVKERIGLIETGAVLYDHIHQKIQNLPIMAPSAGGEA